MGSDCRAQARLSPTSEYLGIVAVLVSALTCDSDVLRQLFALHTSTRDFQDQRCALPGATDSKATATTGLSGVSRRHLCVDVCCAAGFSPTVRPCTPMASGWSAMSRYGMYSLLHIVAEDGRGTRVETFPLAEDLAGQNILAILASSPVRWSDPILTFSLAQLLADDALLSGTSDDARPQIESAGSGTRLHHRNIC